MFAQRIFRVVLAAGLAVALLSGRIATSDDAPPFRISTFSADVTCPVGHPLLGGLYLEAEKVVDPLQARGLVLLGPDDPIVLCAVDWCEIRNQSYDLWRDKLAEAAGTRRERVLVCSLHQHDAPLTDILAQELLAEVGLGGEMFDPRFERACVERTAQAVRESLKHARRITHLGLGKARVERIASSRRVVRPDGSVTYGRGSTGRADAFYRDAPVGLIDPWLRTLSFWDEETPVASLHSYATHPMSYYGKGGVSWDFVGSARDLMQADHPGIFQIYVSGCSGDVTAGKFNDGSPANRPLLAQRLHAAMQQAWTDTHRHPLERIALRNTLLELPFRGGESHTSEALTRVLKDENATKNNRILAAMGLASRRRIEAGQKIDFPCVDFGPAQLVLFPGESFVGYQLMAQQQRSDSFVLSVGYGECWPGYIPTTRSFADRFSNVWYWVGPGSDRRMQEALNKVIQE